MSDAGRGPQRRRYHRLTVRLEVAWRVEPEGSVEVGLATTLGAGGLFIPSPRPLVPGTQIRVRLVLPGQYAVHDLPGEVVWANEPDTPGVPASGRGMGVAFRDRAAQARLARGLMRLPGAPSNLVEEVERAVSGA